MRFLLIDRITAWEPGIRAEAVKNVSASEDFLADHFPRDPMLPGALILEGMAQLAGLLLEEALERGSGLKRKALMTIVEKAKFRRPARPGEQLRYTAVVDSHHEAGGTATVSAICEGKPCAEARLTFAFAAYQNPRLEALQQAAVALWKRDLPDPA